MSKYNKKQHNNILFYLKDFLQRNKLKIVFSILLYIIFIIIGIVIAIKSNNKLDFDSNYGIINIKDNKVSSSTFWLRMLSICIVIIILFLCCQSKWLIPFGYMILMYRTYLLGYYISMMIYLYGLSGIVFSLIIALPCQIIILFLLNIFYILYRNLILNNYCNFNKLKLKGINILFLFLIILLVICLFESLLLLIFNAKIILVI